MFLLSFFFLSLTFLFCFAALFNNNKVTEGLQFQVAVCLAKDNTTNIDKVHNF